ncbi:urease accessory protein UreF [Stappia sp. ICDLI1TA098]
MAMPTPMVPQAMTAAKADAMTVRFAPPEEALYLLLAWLSPSFPVGAYTYSHGLEWAVEDGAVTDAASLNAWLDDVLCHGAGRSDAILLARGMEAASAADEETFRGLLDLALALQPSQERRLETGAQGDAFITAIRAAWMPECGSAAALFDRLTTGGAAIPRGGWAYPLALALAASAWRLPVAATVGAYLHAFVANLVSAAIRAVPLGQSDGQRVMNRLRATTQALSAEAIAAPLDEIGGCAFISDIASMRHETQYTRLFRS